MRPRTVVCGWLCPIRALILEPPVTCRSSLRAGGLKDAAHVLGFLAGDALGVDAVQYADAVPGPRGDESRVVSGVEPGRYRSVELGILSTNPLKAVKWTQPRTLRTVDPRCVVNPGQARRLLAAVGGQGPRGERLVAFFGCMYYAALRPEEATDLRRENLTSLPDHGWGEMILTGSQPRAVRTGPTTARCGSGAN